MKIKLTSRCLIGSRNEKRKEQKKKCSIEVDGISCGFERSLEKEREGSVPVHSLIESLEASHEESFAS